MIAPVPWPRTLLLCLLIVSGCAGRTLPPHVTLPIPRVSSVELIYWTATKQCDVFVLFWDRDTPKSFQAPADPSLCLAWAKSEGYDTKGRP